MIEWKYRIDYNEYYTVEALNKIGKEGWELTAVVKNDQSAYDIKYNYYFKRHAVSELSN